MYVGMYYLLYKINIVTLQCSLFEELRHHIHKIKTLNKNYINTPVNTNTVRILLRKYKYETLRRFTISKNYLNTLRSGGCVMPKYKHIFHLAYILKYFKIWTMVFTLNLRNFKKYSRKSYLNQ